jgi:hypothetical protein
MRVLITGSREASPAMLAKVEEVVLWGKRQGYALLVGDAPGVDAHVRLCAEALSVWDGRSRGTNATFESARRLGTRVVVRTFGVAGGR